MKYVHHTMRMAELGQKCIEAALTLKYEPLNSCITVLGAWIHPITSSHYYSLSNVWIHLPLMPSSDMTHYPKTG